MVNLKRIALLLEFYKGILFISLSFFVLLLFITSIASAFLFSSFIGLIIVLFIKETNKNKDYLYYFNCNLSKVHLYGFSILLNLIITFAFVVIF